MRKLVLLAPILLSGCLATTAPVVPKFPSVPAELLEACPNLKQVPATDKLSEVVDVVSENYIQYHECRTKVDDWIFWYTNQKKIFDNIKN